MSDDTRRPRGAASRTRRPAKEKAAEPRRPRRQSPQDGDGKRPKRRTRRPTDRDVRTKAAKLDGLIDVHIRCGLEDTVVRIKQEDYNGKITLGWMLQRRDIVFRTQLEDSEQIILLRGTDNARLRITRPHPRKAYPMFKVHLTDEIREQMIRRVERGNEKPK